MKHLLQVSAQRLLHIGDFSVHERHFHVGVDVELLGAEVHNLVGLAQGLRDLISRHALLDGLRFGLLLLILRLIATAATTTVPALTVSCLLAAALVITPALLIIAVTHGKHLSDRIFDLSRSHASK